MTAPLQSRARAERVIRFIESLTVPSGVGAGGPFVLRKFQRKFIYAVYTLVGNRRAVRRAILSIARKNGKALALDTKLPTPNGFTTMGAVRVGDTLFDDTGSPCRVTAVTPIQKDRPCYRVRFADGAEVIADADHQWTVNRRGGHREERITTTTGKMAGDYLVKRTDGVTERRYTVDVAGPIHCKPVSLPVPAYTFGVWLGDGDVRGARITCDDRDAEIMAQVQADGVPAKRSQTPGRTPSWRLTDGVRDRTKDCIQRRLRDLGVLGGKRIPALYQRASIDQRMALLQGLMDTDGHATKAGQCELVSVYPELAKDALQLIRGLGFKASMVTDRAQISGVDYGERYRIQFWAYADRPVFRLARKAARLKATPEHPTRNARNAIVGIEPVASVPVRCITVDSPSSLYLFGESFTPTHNTALIAALVLAHLCGPECIFNGEIYSAANDREQAAQVFKMARQMVESEPRLWRILKVVPSTKTIIHHASGSVYRALSAEAGTKHGLNPSVVIYDELAQAKNQALYDVLDTSMGARDEPLFITISTQSKDPQHILSKLIDDARSGADPTTIAHVYAANDDADVLDKRAWRAANPALGDFRSLDDLRVLAERAGRMPSFEGAFRNLYLNQRVSLDATLVTRADWKACAGGMRAAFLPGEEIYLALDLASTTDLAALLAISADPRDDRVQAWFWKPRDLLDEHERRDRFPYREMVDNGLIIDSPGRSIDPGLIAQKIGELDRDYKIKALAYDRWRIETLIRELDHADIQSFKGEPGEGYGIRLVGWGQGYRDMAPAVDALERSIIDRRLVHPGHPVLTWNIANAIVVADPAGNRKLDKSKARFRIDGAVAAAIASGIKAREVDLPGVDVGAMVA